MQNVQIQEKGESFPPEQNKKQIAGCWPACTRFLLHLRRILVELPSFMFSPVGISVARVTCFIFFSPFPGHGRVSDVPAKVVLLGGLKKLLFFGWKSNLSSVFLRHSIVNKEDEF